MLVIKTIGLNRCVYIERDNSSYNQRLGKKLKLKLEFALGEYENTRLDS